MSLALSTSFVWSAAIPLSGATPTSLTPIAPIASPPAAAPSAAPVIDHRITVGLDQLRYQVEPLGSSFRVRVVLSAVPEGGITSYGVTLKFDPNAFSTVTPFFEVPEVLNHNGFDAGGAVQAAGPGFVSVKGTVDFLGQAIVRYDANVIASIILAPKNQTPGSTSPLELAPFYTAGPEEQLWVTGDGHVLDTELLFGSATVAFVPEPTPTSLLGLGAALLAGGFWCGKTPGKPIRSSNVGGARSQSPSPADAQGGVPG